MTFYDLSVTLILVIVGLMCLTAVSYEFLGRDSAVTEELEKIDEEVIEEVLEKK